MGQWHWGSAKQQLARMSWKHLLDYGGYRYFRRGDGGPPLVVQQRLWGWRPRIDAHWGHVVGSHGAWWYAQVGGTLLLFSDQRGPDLLIAQGSWRRMIRCGRGLLIVSLANARPCLVRTWEAGKLRHVE